jgi:hypothetical protein
MIFYIRTILFYFLFLLLISVKSYAQIRINEFMASNSGFLFDPDFGNDDDWIELHNTSDDDINLSGYFASDNRNNPQKWEFPSGTTINANGFLILWADGMDTGLHTNFSLSAAGEFISIHDVNGNLLDSVTFGPQRTNVSYGRKDPHTDQWYYFTEPTPGTPNTTTGYSGFSGIPVILPDAGFYAENQLITMSAQSENEIIRFTLDGSEPDETSPQYIQPFTLDATSVIRAKAFSEGFLPGETINKSFFINEPEHTLPVFSISSAPANWWDPDTGMYVNYQAEKEIEIPIGMEFFDHGMQQFQINAGSEIYGGATRGYAQKSLDIKIRNRYGPAELNYRLFKRNERDVFTSFILRNSGNDWSDGGNWLGTMFCDGLQQSLVKGRMDLDIQSYRPAVVYINGEYWGIQNIREKLDRGYVEYHHGHDPDNLDIIKIGAHTTVNVQRGDSVNFSELLQFLVNNDMNQESNYDYVRTRIDIGEFINYHIVQNFIANIDWPHNNMRFFRPRTEDGKWRWMLYDLDFGFNGFKWTSWPIWEGYRRDMYPNALDPERGIWATGVLSNLIVNQDFKNMFAQRYAYHLNTTFSTERSLHFIDSLKHLIEDEMPRHIARWGSHGGTSSFTNWSNNIEKFVQFAKLRPAFVWQHTMNQFNLADTTTLNLVIVNPIGGHVTLYDTPVMEDTLHGHFFSGVPLLLKAKAHPGFVFTGWVGDTVASDGMMNISLESRTHLKAVFEKIENIFINEFCASNSSTIADEYGEYDDWMEIYNPSPYPVDLGGLYLTDNFDRPFKWMIPDNDPDETTIAAEGFLLFWLDNQPYQGTRHVDFALSRSGEQIAIVRKNGDEAEFIDSLSFGEQITDVTYGRFPDGGENFYFFEKPTPLAPNDTTGLATNITDNFRQPEIDIYPNPTNGTIFIKMNHGETAFSGQQIILDVVNTNGTIMMTKLVEDERNIRLDLHSFPGGIYFIRIITNQNVSTKKIIMHSE